MNIKKNVSIYDMRLEVSRYNALGGRRATLKETMVVEGEYQVGDEYRYHVYAKESYQYRLVNIKPFNKNFTDEDGETMEYDDLTAYGDYEELICKQIEKQLN